VRRSFDVLVAGGGPAGASAALELCRHGLSVALIEQDAYSTFRVGETLPPMIRAKLTALGVWEQFLAADPLESYGIQSVWESATPQRQDFVRNPYGCGWHVDRARFDGLLAAAAGQAGAELLVSARVNAAHKNEEGHWLIQLTQNAATLTLGGRMLVDATGRRAVLAGKLGAQAQISDRLIGAVALSDRHDSEQWTLIEAVEEGWWYSAPVPGGRMVFAYMTDSDLWKAAKWADLLRSAPFTVQRAGGSQIAPPNHIFPAGSVLRQPVAGSDWIAIGDAALAFDPLSGQGVIKSIDSGTQAASAIARCLAGDSGGLAEYEAWVKEAYQAYLTLRRQYYHSVQRWTATSRFWQRRGQTKNEK
jgi:flavin-dependent dehydrogenase